MSGLERDGKRFGCQSHQAQTVTSVAIKNSVNDVVAKAPGFIFMTISYTPGLMPAAVAQRQCTKYGNADAVLIPRSSPGLLRGDPHLMEGG